MCLFVYICTVHAGVFPKIRLIAMGDILWMKEPEYVHSSSMHLW